MKVEKQIWVALDRANVAQKKGGGREEEEEEEGGRA